MTANIEAANRAVHGLTEDATHSGFFELSGFSRSFDMFLKLEGLNPAGSIKLKTAHGLLDSLPSPHPGMELIESTSGNLGVALASLCARRGYRITLVTDPNTNGDCVLHMKALGAKVVIVTERDANDGYLQTRINYILRALTGNPRLHWLNQYTNPANAMAHRMSTAVEITSGFGIPDWLFIGVGTAGTLMGCLGHFQAIGAPTTIVAVDVAGSITFGGKAGRRWIPGLGSSRRPEIFQPDAPIRRWVVTEPDAVRMCRWAARSSGLLLGGSSGAVLAAVWAMRDQIAPGRRVLAISPDMGDRYLRTIFDDEWVRSRLGEQALEGPAAEPLPSEGGRQRLDGLPEPAPRVLVGEWGHAVLVACGSALVAGSEQ